MRSEQEFTVFPIRKQSRKLEPDEVSLTKTNILISAELGAAHFSGVKRVVFVFNEAERVLGIRPAEAGEHAYTLSCRSIASSSMYAHFGIRERGRFSARFEDGTLIVPLRKSSSYRARSRMVR